MRLPRLPQRLLQLPAERTSVYRCSLGAHSNCGEAAFAGARTPAIDRYRRSWRRVSAWTRTQCRIANGAGQVPIRCSFALQTRKDRDQKANSGRIRERSRCAGARMRSRTGIEASSYCTRPTAYRTGKRVRPCFAAGNTPAATRSSFRPRPPGCSGPARLKSRTLRSWRASSSFREPSPCNTRRRASRRHHS